jgi:pyruvate/2-oxoglutarate dehydrogenase complex dihydrolipoamide dehydrogenase (E3) component
MEAGPHVAMGEEPEIGNALVKYLEGEKVRVCANVKINRVERSNGEYRAHAEIGGSDEICRAQQLMVATGRRATTSGFGLEEAGVRLGPKGEIVVNEPPSDGQPGHLRGRGLHGGSDVCLRGRVCGRNCCGERPEWDWQGF